MPKASDYSKSLIYKIEHLDKPELCYVGSTVNLVKRKSLHKKRCNDENYNFKIYRLMREHGGWECFKIVIIKKYPCNSKIELEIEEEKCRKELQANLNSIKCHITKEELIENRKNYYINNRENNKEKIVEKSKKYYEANKEIILEKNKKWKEEHKEDIKEYLKKYTEEHKEHIQEKHKEKMTCVCGSTFRRYSQSRHEKSTKHCEYISNN